MMNPPWKLLITLGVPGVALGAFYALTTAFNLPLGDLPILARGVIAVLVLGLSFLITIYALRLWAPRVEKAEGGLSSPSPLTESRSTVSFGDNASITGDVAGRDIHKGAKHGRKD